MNVDPVVGGVRLDLGIDPQAVHLAFFDHAFACGAAQQEHHNAASPNQQGFNRAAANTYASERAFDLYQITHPFLTPYQARQLAGRLWAEANRAERAS